MTRSFGKSLIASVWGSVAVCTAWSASAFDSRGEAMRARVIQADSKKYDLGPFYDHLPRSPSPNPHYMMTYQHQTHGATTAFFLCPKNSRGGIDDSLQNCTQIPPTNDYFTSAPWARVRKDWTDGRKDLETFSHGDEDGGPEHAVLVEEAARVGGLEEVPLFNPNHPAAYFYVRYPVADRYVASPATRSLLNNKLVVGQAYTPVPWMEVQAHAQRKLYLPELAQMPDISNAIHDWLRGNEECPISGLEIQHEGQTHRAIAEHELKSECHQFENVMGAINMTHFLPSAKRMWDIYHSRAKHIMSRCRDMHARLGDDFAYLHKDYWEGGQFIGTFAGDSEVHECEREALAHEMFAQHFLQDAWSTGHMWARWGEADISRFHYQVPQFDWYPDWDNNVPTENIPARRLALALVVARFAGLIHGPRSVGFMLGYNFNLALGSGAFDRERILQTPVWRKAYDVLSQPLCAPTYEMPNKLNPLFTQWVDPSTGNPTPGGGDLYIRQIFNDKEFVVQRERMLGCAAASLRDVYMAGPMLHGPVTEPKSFVAAISDPAGPECWGQRVRNRSIADAASPVPPKRVAGAPWLQRVAFYGANALVVPNAFGKVDFPNAGDGDAFKKRVEKRMQVDTKDFVNYAIDNAETNPNGTDTAENPGTFLGVRPNDPSSLDTVPYFDWETNNASARLVFWRSHLAETCTEVEAARALRDRCIAATAEGGDPDACTACAALVEPHIPLCFANRLMGTSKCEELGVENPAEWPAWWRDWDRRVAARDCHQSGFNNATSWCTGRGGSEGPVDDTPLTYEIVSSQVIRSHRIAGTDSTQVDEWFTRLTHHNYKHQPPLAPVVFSYPDTHYGNIDTRTFIDGRLESVGAKLVENARIYVDPATRRERSLVEQRYYEDQLIGPVFCGVTQRVSLWDKDCFTAASALGVSLSPIEACDGAADQNTGFSCLDVPPPYPFRRCLLREPRVLSDVCPVAIDPTTHLVVTTGVCTSGGLCIKPACNGAVCAGNRVRPLVHYFDTVVAPPP